MPGSAWRVRSSPRFHRALGSNETTMASIRVSAPNANSPGCGSTVARLVILTTVIRMPIISTSVMPHSRAVCTARSTRLKPGTLTPPRRPRATYSREPSSMAGKRMVNRKTIVATMCICSYHSTRMEPSKVALDVRPLTSSSTMGKNWAIRKTKAAPRVSATTLVNSADAPRAWAPRYSTERQRMQRAFSRGRSGRLRYSTPQS